MKRKPNETVRVFRTGDVAACLCIRRAVFIEEQSVPPELEIDELDLEGSGCDHFLIVKNGENAGTFRCFFESENVVHLQRFCVLPDFRGSGCGRAALAFAEDYYAGKGAALITLNAQCSAVPFYELCGYKTVSDVFFDAGIPHKKMIKSLSSGS